MLDYIIVGQGIAGTCLAIRLLETGKALMIIDNGHQHSSSMVAAGIINPITGRYFTKSWMIDDLVSEIEKFYFPLQNKWNIRFIRKTSIIRTFHDAKSENNWYAKMDNSGYSRYMAENADLGDFDSLIHPPYGYGEVLNAYQMDLPLFLNVFKQKNDAIFETDLFDYNELKIHDSCVSYKDLKARNIVFAEGYKVINNPFFKGLPFQPAKGEVLLIEIKGTVPNKILRDKMFICPVGNNIYWVGSGYEWHNLDEIPTSQHRDKIQVFLEKILKKPFKIVGHLAGVRPSTSDRRPILGTHETISKVHIFNGMGTKGTSLSPFWSLKMANYLEGTTELPAEVHVSRF